MGPIRFCVLIAALVFAASASRAQDEVVEILSDEFIVDATHPAPATEAPHLGKRFAEFKKDLPEGYGVAVTMATFGGGGVKRYAESLTPLNPQGKPDGIAYTWMDWYHPPILKTVYKDGVKDGVEVHYFPGTRDPVVKAEITWVKGELNGPKKTYNQDGSRATESTFVDGVISGESRSWAKNGNLLRIATFKDGKRHGKVTDFWPDRPDAVKREIVYKDGQVDGLAREFYANGQVKWERPFVDNKQHGIETQYDADGTVLKKKYWIDGEEVEEDAYTAAIK